MAASAELTAEMDARATWVNIQAGGYVSAAMTLDGFYSYWVISMLDFPYQLSTNTPLEAARIWGINFCNAHPGVDCSQLNELYPAFGNFLAAAMNGQPLPALPPPPYATGTPPTVPGIVNAATPPIPPPPAPIDISVPNPALAALMTTAPAPTDSPTPVAPTPTTTPTPTTVAVPGPAFAGAHAMYSVGTGISGAGAGATAGAPLAVPTFGISIVVGAIIGALLGFLGGGSDTKALQAAINKVAQSLADTADALERFSWSIAVGLGRLAQAVATIWDSFLDGLWSSLKRLWQYLEVLADKIIPAIINVIKDLRKFLDHIYTTYILKAMRYLLYVRQALAILRALHIPIAGKLDKILGQIQGALYVPFLGLAQVVGGYGAWINVLLTNRYLLQRPVFLRSMWAYQSDWINIFWLAQSAGVGTGVQNTGAGAPALLSNTVAVDELKQYVATRSGPMAAEAAAAQAMLAAARSGNV